MKNRLYRTLLILAIILVMALNTLSVLYPDKKEQEYKNPEVTEADDGTRFEIYETVTIKAIIVENNESVELTLPSGSVISVYAERGKEAFALK